MKKVKMLAINLFNRFVLLALLSVSCFFLGWIILSERLFFNNWFLPITVLTNYTIMFIVDCLILKKSITELKQLYSGLFIAITCTFLIFILFN